MSLWPQFLKRKKIETPQRLDFIALEADVPTQRTILNYTQALLGRHRKKLIERRTSAHAPVAGRAIRRFPAISSASQRRNCGRTQRGRRSERSVSISSIMLGDAPIPLEHAGDCQAAPIDSAGTAAG
jgi:hypothetical protein